MTSGVQKVKTYFVALPCTIPDYALHNPLSDETGIGDGMSFA
jgi:hypothetical protein